MWYLRHSVPRRQKKSSFLFEMYSNLLHIPQILKRNDDDKSNVQNDNSINIELLEYYIVINTLYDVQFIHQFHIHDCFSFSILYYIIRLTER